MTNIRATLVIDASDGGDMSAVLRWSYDGLVEVDDEFDLLANFPGLPLQSPEATFANLDHEERTTLTLSWGETATARSVLRLEAGHWYACVADHSRLHGPIQHPVLLPDLCDRRHPAEDRS
jgi:hypothetical protein